MFGRIRRYCIWTNISLCQKIVVLLSENGLNLYSVRLYILMLYVGFIYILRRCLASLQENIKFQFTLFSEKILSGHVQDTHAPIFYMISLLILKFSKQLQTKTAHV